MHGCLSLGGSPNWSSHSPRGKKTGLTQRRQHQLSHLMSWKRPATPGGVGGPRPVASSGKWAELHTLPIDTEA